MKKKLSSNFSSTDSKFAERVQNIKIKSFPYSKMKFVLKIK